MAKVDDAILSREVAGEYNTLRIYLFMLRARNSTVRETQRALNLSSPTLAQHHLDKLVKYGLAAKNYNGTYSVIPRSFGILRFYVRSGKWIVPRTIFFVMMFGFLAIGFAALVPEYRYSLAFSAVSALGLAYSVYETVRFYRTLPGPESSS